MQVCTTNIGATIFFDRVMEIPFLSNKLSRVLELDLPVLETLDAYTDYILPIVGDWSADLESDDFMDIRWKEVRDTDDFHEDVLHIFKPGGEYIVITDGNIGTGSWSKLNGGFVRKFTVLNEFYNLKFLNADFFVLQKHGDQVRKGQRKYLFFARESAVKNMQWRDVAELFFDIYRNNHNVSRYVIIILFVIGLMVVASLYLR